MRPDIRTAGAVALPDERREVLHLSGFVEVSAPVDSAPAFSPPAFYRELFAIARGGTILEIREEVLESLGGRIGCVACWADQSGIRCLYDVMRRRLVFARAESLPVTQYAPRESRSVTPARIHAEDVVPA